MRRMKDDLKPEEGTQDYGTEVPVGVNDSVTN